MRRLVGAALLELGAMALGMCAVEHLRGRVRDLRGLISGIEEMIRELDYRLLPLPELFERASECAQGKASLFFDLCGQGADHLNGRRFYAVWTQAAEAAQMRLEEEDLAILERLGAVLGRYDGDSQREALAAAAGRLARQQSCAEEQSCRLGRIYRVLSFTAGAFLVILLI